MLGCIQKPLYVRKLYKYSGQEMNILIKESTMVVPAEERLAKRLWNSILDLTAQKYHIQVQLVYFYPNNGTSDFFDTNVMKSALSKVLVPFYPMAGRFAQGEEGRLEIDCRGQGALFLEAESDGVIDDFGDFAPRPEFLKLVPEVDYSQGVESYPLFLAQVTYFKCGGVSLGVCLHHRAVDGTSAIHFMNTWSDMARGLDVALQPYIDRTLLRARDPPQPLSKLDETPHDPPMNVPLMDPFNAKTKTVSLIYKITRDQIDGLKTKSKENGNTIRYSSFEILAGHVWKCACKARGLTDDEMTKINISVDARARLQPSLPSGYFGNTVLTATAAATTGKIQSNHSWYAASKIHSALENMNSDYIRSELDYLEQNIDRKPKFSYNRANLRMISWARLPIHDADFGWGRPIHTGPTWMPLEGFCFVLPSPTKDASFLVIIALQDEQMKLFSKLLFEDDA